MRTNDYRTFVRRARKVPFPGNLAAARVRLGADRATAFEMPALLRPDRV